MINEKTNLPAEFVTDCAVWVLFNGCNNSSEFTANYKGSDYFIKNEFNPYSRGFTATASGKEVPREETFVHLWLKERVVSWEAEAVLEAGRAVYSRFYRELPNLDSDKWKLETANPGWYQIRMSMKERFGNDFPELEELKKVYKVLGDKLRPQVYSLGFLPPVMELNNTNGENDETVQSKV